MKDRRLLFIALSGIIAAVYVALCYVLQPISFGTIQFRFSEMLCLLSIDFLWAFAGVSIGCLLANMFIGGLGIVDIVFGTLATVIGCGLAHLFRNKRYKDYPLLSAMMIVIVNAVIIGGELAYILETPDLLWLYMFQVGFGEFVVLAIGLPIYKKVKPIIEYRTEK